jgi:hypothetical protein
MSTTCKTADVWDQRAARNWWKLHLPHLATPVKANANVVLFSTGLAIVVDGGRYGNAGSTIRKH